MREDLEKKKDNEPKPDDGDCPVSTIRTVFLFNGRAKKENAALPKHDTLWRPMCRRSD